MPGLDPTNHTPAYVAGRAFAVLEQLQHASAGERRNATYGDRYFSGAIANPKAALVAGRRDATAWLRKLRRSRTGAAIYYERELDSIFGLLGPTGDVPARTTLTDQSLFLLGYHHQRAHRITAARAAAAGAATADDDVKETDQ